MNMKNKVGILVTIAALFSGAVIAQEDSVTVKESTKETTTVKESKVQQPVVVHDTVVKEKKNRKGLYYEWGNSEYVICQLSRL